MTTRKRADAKEGDAKERSCVVCIESEPDTQLIKPCRYCESDYCVDCVIEMFLSATKDSSRMPPRCCNFIQLYMILRHLTPDQGERYRAKFEEWITPVKTYCPSPTCSAFISEKHVPIPAQATPQAPSMKSVLTNILAKVSISDPARFFRGEIDITHLPGFTTVIKHPIDLNMIQANLDRYGSVNDLTLDMRLIVSNAREYNGEDHPVTKAANELFNKYLQEVSNVTDCLIGSNSTPPAAQLFACPTCHVAICSKCRKVEHTGTPCDTSAEDYELAMLEKFGYKRCPSCKIGVKKMFGCTHMQCICGAHWCWRCQKSVNACDGSCDDDEAEEAFEEGYDSEEDESDEEILRLVGGREDRGSQANPITLASDSNEPPQTIAQAAIQQQPANQHVHLDNRVVNLDAGGERRWADRDFNFGVEPDDEPYLVCQVWSCNHSFSLFEPPPNDGYNRGDLDRIECNRCFEKIVPQKGAQPFPTAAKKRRKNGFRAKDHSVTTQEPKADDGEKTKGAWECSMCCVLVCLSCRDKFTEAKAQ